MKRPTRPTYFLKVFLLKQFANVRKAFMVLCKCLWNMKDKNAWDLLLKKLKTIVTQSPRKKRNCIFFVKSRQMLIWKKIWIFKKQMALLVDLSLTKRKPLTWLFQKIWKEHPKMTSQKFTDYIDIFKVLQTADKGV